MNKAILLIILLFSSKLLATDISYCENLLGQCSFYDCTEDTLQCGRRGYPLSFGKKYCNKFDKHQHRLSVVGRKWMDRTKVCLMELLLENSVDNSCNEIEKQAFKDHVTCYYETGYCDLSSRDQRKVLRIIKSSFWRPRIIRTGLKLEHMCLKN